MLEKIRAGDVIELRVISGKLQPGLTCTALVSETMNLSVKTKIKSFVITDNCFGNGNHTITASLDEPQKLTAFEGKASEVAAEIEIIAVYRNGHSLNLS
jgi:hypothetical protein